MSDTHERPWSDSPNAPKIPYDLYFREKANFAGYLIGAILYGTPRLPYRCVRPSVLTRFVLGALIALFFRCMVALLNPIHPKEKTIKWGLVSYTVAMFSVATVQTAMYLNRISLSYIDNREFPGLGNGWLYPGPAGYQFFMSSEALAVVPNFMFALNNWLADGFLVSSLLDVVLTHPSV